MDVDDVKLVRIVNPLRGALTGPRKLQREWAVRQAESNVELRRDDLLAGLATELANIEAILSPDTGHLSPDAMQAGIRLAPIVFNLAGVLGYPNLQAVAASLHDLLVIMLNSGRGDIVPVVVHLQAARLVAPGMPAVPEEAAKQLLVHLRKVIAHFRDETDPA